MAERSLYRRVIQLAIPVVLANLSVPLLGAVDTAIMGHMDAPYYLAALAIGPALGIIAMLPLRGAQVKAE